MKINIMKKIFLIFFTIIISFLYADEGIPNPPKNLTFTNITKNSVTLHWQDNSTNETGFKIFRDDELLYTSKANITSYTDNDLVLNTTYTYTIKATNDETTTIIGISRDAVAESIISLSKKLYIDSSSITVKTISESRIEISLSSSEVTKYIDTPLYIDGEYKGNIASVTNKNGVSEVILKKSSNPSEVYSSFDLEFNLDEIEQTLSRSLKKKKIGKYDHLNKEPLKISFYKKNIPGTGKSRKLNEELILRVDIPKGYRMPIKPRKIDCDFLNASCDITLGAEANKSIGLGKEKTEYGLTFSTKGSYVEFGIGAYLKAKYDYNLNEANELNVDVRNSAYFKSDLTFKTTGKLEKNWKANLDFAKKFDIVIPHPYKKFVKATVTIQPAITVGAGGEIKAEVEVNSHTERNGEIRFSYDSHSGFKTFTHIDTPPPTTTVTFDIEANGNIFISPNITIIPKFSLLNINKDLSFGRIRNSIKTNGELQGKITSKYIVENDGINNAFGVKTEFTISAKPIVDFKPEIKLGDEIFYEKDEYSKLYEGNATKIFSWKMVLLPDPQIVLDLNTNSISFDIPGGVIEIDEIKDDIKFFYTLDGNDIPLEEKTTSLQATLWDKQPIVNYQGEPLKVRAIYSNDNNESSWSKGISFSRQIEFNSPERMRPAALPGHKSRIPKNSPLQISLSYEKSGFDLYYTTNGKNPNESSIKYLEPIDISDTVLLKAIAISQKSGAKSPVGNFLYYKQSNNKPLYCPKSSEKTNEEPPEYCTYKEYNVWKENDIDYYSYDHLIKEVKNGHTRIYHDNSEQIKEERYDNSGLIKEYSISGEMTHYINPTKVINYNILGDSYTNGVFENSLGTITIYKDNSSGLKIEENFSNGLDDRRESINGKKEGKELEYYSNGKIKTIIEWKDGVKEGKEISYFENGQTSHSIEWKDGEKDGKEIGKYYSIEWKDGKKDGYEIFSYGRQIFYKEDVQQYSIYRYFHTNGELKEIIYYDYIDSSKSFKKVFTANGELQENIYVYDNHLIEYFYNRANLGVIVWSYHEYILGEDQLSRGRKIKKIEYLNHSYDNYGGEFTTEYTHYNENGRIYLYEVFNSDGFKVTTHKLINNQLIEYLDGTYKTRGFIDGDLGKMIIITDNYKNNNIETRYINYTYNGKNEILNFKNGVLHGLYKRTAADGKIEACSYLEDGEFVKRCTNLDIQNEYYKNGKLKLEIPYSYGKINGYVKMYDEDGTLLPGCQHYENGELKGYIAQCSSLTNNSTKSRSVKYWLWDNRPIKVGDNNDVQINFNQPLKSDNLQIALSGNGTIEAVGISEKEVVFDYHKAIEEENLTISGEGIDGDDFTITQRYRAINSDDKNERVIEQREITPPIEQDFIIDKNFKIVVDTSTGLMWQNDEEIEQNWIDAVEYCENLELGGFDNWRLPTVLEIDSIITLNNKEEFDINKIFQDIKQGFYWTNDTKDPDQASTINIIKKQSEFRDIYRSSNVKCIRQRENY